MAALALKIRWDVDAWVLMPNHFHLLVKTRNYPLSQNMRRLLTGYVVNFNGRHRRHGHLFQNRYKSIVCQEDLYLRGLIQYIHLKRLRAKIVLDIKELNRDGWSGHLALERWTESGRTQIMCSPILVTGADVVETTWILLSRV